MAGLTSSFQIAHFPDHGEKPDRPVALKEWAVAEKALREGRQNLLLRKGGIREETKHFALEGTSFFLYPTYEHQKEHLIREPFRGDLIQTVKEWSENGQRLYLRSFAQVTEEIAVTEAAEVDALSPYHIWTEHFVEERLRWKRHHPLHILLVRVFVIENPVQIEIREEYLGCKSWVRLEQELPGFSFHPVLSEAEFQRRREEVLRHFMR